MIFPLTRGNFRNYVVVYCTGDRIALLPLCAQSLRIIKAPIETKIIEEVKPPPPDMPPPPPPKMAAPPPPCHPAARDLHPGPQGHAAAHHHDGDDHQAAARPAAADPAARPGGLLRPRRWCARSSRPPIGWTRFSRARRSATEADGKVVARLQVAPGGKVTQVQVKSSTPQDFRARNGAAPCLQWRFNPEPVGFYRRVRDLFST